MTKPMKSITVPIMFRLLAIFLLIALPLAWTTTAVAAYCKHESMPSEQNHLGHHADRDHAPSTTPDSESDDGGSKPHAHCSISYTYCSAFPSSNSSYSALLITTCVSWLSDASPFSSLLPDEPERPKWSVAA